MNERIQKLAREAALAEGWGPGVWQTTFTEKFAELIVRECVSVCEQHPSRIGSNNWPTDEVALDIVSRLEKHFGVGE